MKRRGLVGQTSADEVLQYTLSLVLSDCYSNIKSQSLVTFINYFQEFNRPGIHFENPRDTSDIMLEVLLP